MHPALRRPQHTKASSGGRPAETQDAAEVHRESLRAVWARRPVVDERKAGLHADRSSGVAALPIKTHLGGVMPQRAHFIGWGTPRHHHVLGDVVEEPLEGPTAQLLAKPVPRVQGAQGVAGRDRGASQLDQVLVLIHPHLCDSQLVAIHVLQSYLVDLALPVQVRPPYVPDMGARHVLNAAPALPRAEADFDLLAAINSHLLVVAAEMQEEGAVPCEEPPAHDRGVGNVLNTLGPLTCTLGECPLEADQTEAKHGVLKLLRPNAVDARHHKPRAVLADARQQRLQPAGRGLDVAVKADDDLARGAPNPLHARQHDAPPLAQSHQPRLRQCRTGVVRQLLLEAVPMPPVEAAFVRHAGVVHQDDLLQIARRRVVEHRVHRPDQRDKVLVVEHDDDACSRQVTRVLLVPRPATPGAHVGLGTVDIHGLAGLAVETEASVGIADLLPAQPSLGQRLGL
mmetsp:Transcript_128279/g.411059  ORF Transcript_128279/g.411059 Transcript_128279/m.411059 type:complete len:455 (-) Transcript_128279:371-1735(-)